ncbi:hypothetical protein E3P89_03649 [Wallemia ichthyophaga]|uniref:RNA polymerase I-specific transcription initiation factor rrn7 n=2 Tax=Wallemia ichthyophaga TaxID=245174 RepID=A0A4T0EV54_WALIC|nr:hypothetical protein E3P98_03952 [Wallemia ichthyophaga]TIB08009.1 hypothetical protein E3P93_03665 [Wallemia ichthyophaga]TIB08474.1 hypothetical protein E3P90_03680 [Wallemia ichthyophaga]TIB19800.1 hypothetical protein E3P89_03649 [Wallemia ichthyophaga]TIB21025.1 hypothetical protein E3P88_03662 [Wallemia ichthyophaga]
MTVVKKNNHEMPNLQNAEMDKGSFVWTCNGFRNETQEDGAIRHQAQQRYIKKGRQVRKKVLKSHAWYSGDKLRFLHLQAQQLILRRQVECLIAIWGLPNEFEIVIRDLWALRVSLLKDLVAAPIEMARRRSTHEQTDDEDDKEDDKEDSKEDTKHDDKEEPSDNSDDALEDPDEMLGNLETPPSDEDMNQPQTMEEALEAANRVKTTRRVQSAVDEFSMIWLLAVLNLGFWTLRLPVFHLDFKAALQDRRVPYMDALAYLPEPIKARLNPSSRTSFQAETLPSLRKVHRASIYLARQMRERYAVTFSDYNVTPVLWRCVHDLGLPPTMHTLCMEMVQRIGISFSLLPHHRMGKRSKHRKGEACAPEIIAMAVVVSVCTLVYNLDNEVTDQPRIRSLLDKNKWIMSLDKHFKLSDSILNDQVQIIDATDEQVDDFLDYMERTVPVADEDTIRTWPPLADELRRTGDPHRIPAVKQDSNWFHSLYEDRIPLDAYPAQPEANLVRSYHTSDRMGDYPILYDRLLKASAKAIGVSHPEEIAHTVEMFHKRLGLASKQTSSRRTSVASEGGINMYF